MSGCLSAHPPSDASVAKAWSMVTTNEQIQSFMAYWTLTLKQKKTSVRACGEVDIEKVWGRVILQGLRRQYYASSNQHDYHPHDYSLESHSPPWHGGPSSSSARWLVQATGGSRAPLFLFKLKPKRPLGDHSLPRTHPFNSPAQNPGLALKRSGLAAGHPC
jgi:hypothetical protein